MRNRIYFGKMQAMAKMTNDYKSLWVERSEIGLRSSSTRLQLT